MGNKRLHWSDLAKYILLDFSYLFLYYCAVPIFIFCYLYFIILVIIIKYGST